jgi:hypothetical protein
MQLRTALVAVASRDIPSGVGWSATTRDYHQPKQAAAAYKSVGNRPRRAGSCRPAGHVGWVVQQCAPVAARGGRWNGRLTVWVLSSATGRPDRHRTRPPATVAGVLLPGVVLAVQAGTRSSWCVRVGSNDGPWDDEGSERRHSNLLLADGPLSHKGCWPAEAWETEPHTKRVMAATRPGGRIPSTSISVYRRRWPEEDRRASARPGSSRSRITVRLKSSVPTR